MNIVTVLTPAKLRPLSDQIRLDLLDMFTAVGESHVGGCLSSLDLMVAVYCSGIFKFPDTHFVLSAGHYAPALYTILANLNYFPKEWLKNYSDYRSPLQGHISTDAPGVEFSAGLLGQGLSFASGLALGEPKRTSICLTSDGEHNEGQIWEAAMFASKYHLGNLINIVDHNKYQIDGSTDDIMPLGDLAAKYLRFGWTVTTVDGHDFGQITKALVKSQNSSYPNCIIANTVFAQGVPAWQYDYHYHDVKEVNSVDYTQAVNLLKSKL